MTIQDESRTGSNDRPTMTPTEGSDRRCSKRLSAANDAAAVPTVAALLSIAKLLGRREGARLVALNDNASA